MIRAVAFVIAIALLTPRQSLAPFVPSAEDEDVVDRILALAGVRTDDTVVDLESSDGHIPIRAAQKYGARARPADSVDRYIRARGDEVPLYLWRIR